MNRYCNPMCRRQFFLKFCFYFLATLTSISTALYIATIYLKRIFGSVSIEQILFNISTSEACSFELLLFYAIRAIPYVLAILAMTFAIFYIVNKLLVVDSVKEVFSPIINLLKLIWAKLNGIRRAIDERPIVLLAVILLAALISTGKTVDRRLKVRDFLARTDTPFVAENYARLDPNSAILPAGKPKNLIVIFSESLEWGYADESIYGRNLIRELQASTNDGLYLRGYKKTAGGRFTLDGISAQTLGMPLTQVPIDIHSEKSKNAFGVVLRKSPSIFNLLNNAGYKTAFFSGTSRDFTHKADFLKVHGFIETYFEEDWLEKGFKLDDNNRGSWSFNDRFLLSRFTDYLNKLNGKAPFALVFETVDTHAPYGWTPMNERHYNDARDAFLYSSKLLAGFINWARTQSWFKDTVIVVVGDHPWQDHVNDFSMLTKKSSNREIFATIINSEVKTLNIQDCGYSAMDIAPTILDAMGIKFRSQWKSGESTTRIGLGTSLFSNEKNLVCTYGVQDFTMKLDAYSDFYNSLHEVD